MGPNVFIALLAAWAASQGTHLAVWRHMPCLTVESCRNVPLGWRRARRRGAAHLALLLSALGSMACQDPDEPSTFVAPRVPGSGCSPSRDYPVSAHNLELNGQPDYVAVQAPTLVSNGAGGSRWSLEIVSYSGQQCPDQPAGCIVPLRAAAEGQSCEQGVCDGIITRHGNVFQNVPLQKAADLLAPIDTPAEALLIVRALGFDVSCMDVSAPDSDGAYQVTGRKDAGATFFEQYCAYVPVRVQQIRVVADGSVQLGETHQERRMAGCARIKG